MKHSTLARGSHRSIHWSDSANGRVMLGEGQRYNYSGHRREKGMILRVLEKGTRNLVTAHHGFLTWSLLMSKAEQIDSGQVSPMRRVS